MKKNDFVLIPLGGTGEIGKNLNLYGYQGQWLIVDFGITFADYTTPGYDIIMPDITYLLERKSDILGIVITHAHEDHVGALPYLWPQLECPIYASKFTLSVIQHKFRDFGIKAKEYLHELRQNDHQKIGNFTLHPVYLTHSIPEPNALVIETEAGKIFHTGDWKIDPSPLVGDPIEVDYLKKIGDQGIDVIVCDSTNAMQEGQTKSEKDVRENLTSLIETYPKNRIVVSCFSSNIARLETIAYAAKKSKRVASLSGRSLWRMYEIAKENGYLKDSQFVPEEKIQDYAPSDIIIGCTGSQGEPRAALSRIADKTHPCIKLEKNDVIIFSSRIIPGNEKPIYALHNKLIALGYNLITHKDNDAIHVSGHPARQDLIDMLHWIRPKAVIPVHGEYCHLLAHSNLAKEQGYGRSVIAENGSVICLNQGDIAIIDKVHAGRWVLDGKQIIPLTNPLIRKRDRIILEGYVVATIVLDQKGKIKGDVQLNAFGIWEYDPDDNDWWGSVQAIHAIMEKFSIKQLKKDQTLINEIEKGLRSYIKNNFGKRSFVEVNIVRI